MGRRGLAFEVGFHDDDDMVAVLLVVLGLEEPAEQGNAGEAGDTADATVVGAVHEAADNGPFIVLQGDAGGKSAIGEDGDPVDSRAGK